MTIKKGKKALKENEHLVGPRKKEPWVKITDMKVLHGKPVIIDKTEKKLSENDALDFDNLLGDEPAPIDENPSNIPGPSNDTTAKTEVKTSSAKKVASKVVKVEKQPLIIKRNWAVLANCDDDSIYRSRKYKSFGLIKDLTQWVKRNICEFEDEKMFETLLTNEDLFTNPGLSDHQGARQFMDEIVLRRGVVRRVNTDDIGFRTFFRTIMKDVFKEKARGLALRNFQVFLSDGTMTTMEKRRKVGQLLDEIINQAEEVDGGSGRSYFEIDRFKVERAKRKHIPILTDNNEGTIRIEVYAKDVILPKDKWLIQFLEHTSFCWDNVAMMLYRSRRLRYDDLRDYFSGVNVQHYNEAIPALNKLLRDPTVLAPEQLSKTFLTPLNTKWEWDETTYNVKAIEIWQEDNEMSDLKLPVNIDKMVERLIDQLNNDSNRFNDGLRDPTVVLDFQRSLW